MNFAQAQTNIPGVCILYNEENAQKIFCIIACNEAGHRCSPSVMQMIEKRLVGAGVLPENILFIAVTDDPGRDRDLTYAGINIWLADTTSGRLLIYEEQPTDFYGIRASLEQAAAGDFSDGMFEFESSKRENAGNYPQKHKSQRSLRNFPAVTLALIILNVVYYLILASGGRTTDTQYMLQMGANFGPYIFSGFEIWRLFLSMFMHFSLSHLIGNMIYLGILGYNLERSISKWKFILIYMLSGIGGNLVSAAYYQIKGSYTVSAGASGAIYGLIGAIAVITFMNYRRLKPLYLFMRIAILLVFVFYSSFADTGIDGAAHVGGFCFGILLTAMLVIERKRKNEKS